MLSVSREIQLAAGRLILWTTERQWGLDELCDFASRRNPKRGFLIVSRVLGRHLPARPREMRRSAHDLARQLPADLPGPVLVVGLAETAVCLGQIVHAEYRTLSGRDDVVYLHSTRQRIEAEVLAEFREPHSHAAAHLLYRPRLPGFVPPRSLVLVDDEISTGTTLANLAAALTDVWPGVGTIVAACLTDWSGGAWLASVSRPATSVSLLSGTLEWHGEPEAAVETAQQPTVDALGAMTFHSNRGRLGVRTSAMDLPHKLPLREQGQPVRVIGTGEFGYAPFLLAERLEEEGVDVVVQSTSRSPAHLGGAMRHALVFADNYGSGVPNYLYNAPAGDGRANWLCCETPAGSVDEHLASTLNAKVLAWPA
jgi:hypothetical protein